ncbi:HNH endonuclease [Streptomyces uncialis]|uniref:HNH endonuclease n=1 Tax=Streptomyces uncialis TaxID=1048205 RepID=UPI002E35FC5D|nr:HNH endonuclease signature motif containing protein [Streptomyces uncialis]
MTWKSSNRRAELPPNWAALRQRVIRRDRGFCRGVLSEGAPCTYPGTQVDHIRPGADHSMENLQLLCTWCHKRKTQAESRAARANAKPLPKTHIRRDQREAAPSPW